MPPMPGIPWFSLIAGVDPHPALIPYGITGREIGAVYDAWLFEEIAKREGRRRSAQGNGDGRARRSGSPSSPSRSSWSTTPRRPMSM